VITTLGDDELVKSLQKSFYRRPFNFPQRAYKLASIDLDSLVKQGIRGIILDLDNTIVSEDDRYLSPGAETWIEDAKRCGMRLFILSNGKRRHRVVYWSARLGVPAISPAHKPFPKSFRKAISYMRLTASQVKVIGDSRHTDMLGAWLAGCSSIQVATLPHPFRWWERLFGKWVQSPYPDHHELWDFVE
jgi:HAD superfamily phosphatase (TIGR01668 family)